jgi:hypothetical protein
LVCHRALVNMHLRFDGKLGFPGGLVETEEDEETGKYCTVAEPGNLSWSREKKYKEYFYQKY